LWLGRPDELEARCTRYLREARPRQNRYAVADLLGPISSARLLRGDLEGAQRALHEAPREFFDGPPTLPKVHLRRAELDTLLAVGDPLRAAQRYDELLSECGAIIQAPAWLRVEVAQAGLRIGLALLRQGDIRGAARCRSLEKQSTDGASPARLARSLRYLAEFDFLSQNPNSARLRLTAAEACLARQSAPVEKASLLRRLAQLDPRRQREAEQAAKALRLGRGTPSGPRDPAARS
jgi:tetratricopeptide (TPR) repeat protein